MVEPATLWPAQANRFLVLDLDTPWISSLLDELPDPWSFRRIGARSAGLKPVNWWRAYRDGFVGIPGWTRAFRISTTLLARAVRQYIAKQGRPRAIVHTMPWTAGLLHWFPDESHVYRPQDYFGNYEWDQTRVLALERELMKECQVAIPMSPEHAGDLRLLGPIPVEVLPNGVSTDFVRRLRQPQSSRPSDLPDSGQLVVGCIGQVNSMYDWDTISELADLLPHVVFLFVGPIIEESPTQQRRIDEVFRQSNIRWIGAKPHANLPDYLHHFDICWSPLQVSPANNRRSLLRLFDYLASDKPVISTAVAAAKSHGDLVLLSDTARETAKLIQEIQAGGHPVDHEARRLYVDRQTWAVRGIRLTEYIDSYCPLGTVREK